MKTACFVFCLIMSLLLNAQSDVDTTLTRGSFQIKYRGEAFKNLEPSLDVSNFESFSFIQSNTSFTQYSIGNLSSRSSLKRYLVPEESLISRSMGNLGYFPDLAQAQNVPIYNVKSPISELHYSSVYGRGSYFGGYFSQNIHERFNYYINYTRLHSEGKYFRQETVNDDFRFSTNYKSPSSHYSITLNFIWNKIKAEENGGIQNDSVFEQNLESTRELVPINLWGSSSVARKTEALLNQYFDLKSDSLGSYKLFLHHSLNYVNQNYRFKSSDTTFNHYYFSDLTRDSIHNSKLKNEINLGLTGKSKQLIYSGEVGTYLVNQSYSSRYFDQEIFELGLSLWANLEINKCYHINIQGAQNLTNNTYNYKVDFSYGYTQSTLIGLQGNIINYKPSLFSEKHISNQYIWNNNFDNQGYLKVGAFVKRKQWLSIYANYLEYDQYVYFDFNGKPSQLSDKISSVQTKVEVQKKFEDLGLGLNFIYNEFITKPLYNPVPQLIGDVKLFYNYSILKNILKCQSGMEVRYFSSYFANAYNPSGSYFYLQQDKQVGNYPILDVFTVFKVSSFKIILKIENLLQGVIPYNYYALPGYPLNDRIFRIGFKWRFFN